MIARILLGPQIGLYEFEGTTLPRKVGKRPDCGQAGVSALVGGMKPLLRWAGSKRKQLDRLALFWSKTNTGYIEPFAGSACLFFAIAPTNAVLGDSNKELIELYRVVRDQPESLYRRLCAIRRMPGTYRRWRAMDPRKLDRETRALRFLYLNRNCFNGIYRTNTDGHFNVPMGSKLSAYLSLEDFVRCSIQLQNAKLVAGDFEKTLEHVGPGNFVYLDPPYAVSSRRIFREYGMRTFNTLDISRLGEGLQEVHRKRADFVVSYADCREARILAKNWEAVRLPVRRNVAGFSGARRTAYEWIIANLPAERIREAVSCQT